MKKAPSAVEASPYKSVAEELEGLQRMFREICQRYAERIEAEIGSLRDRVVEAGASATAIKGKSAGDKRTIAVEKFHDLRDMLTVLRTLQIKPQDGRRKDLKKIEVVLQELQLLTKRWA